jgi:outer membrane protein assembly factor BamB
LAGQGGRATIKDVMKPISRLAAAVATVALAATTSLGFAAPASAAFDPGPVGPAWTPDGPVHAVTVAGNRVFVGGSFSEGIVALDAQSGGLLWKGNANGDVRALAVTADGSSVIAGGAFTAVGGATHRKLALLSAATGAVDGKWRASAGGTVRDIVVSGDTAYFGGSFTKHNGIVQSNLGAVSTTPNQSAVPRTGFDARSDGIVYALDLSGSRLVIGGRFTSLSGAARNQLGSFDVSSNSLDGWKPEAACDGCNLYWDLTVAGDTVYAVSRNYGAATAVDLGTGARRWRTSANGDAQAVTVVDGQVYVGGHFSTIKGVDRKILAALNPATGAVESFSSRFVGSFPGIWALDSTSSRLYVGGHFTAAGPLPNSHPYLAFFGN